MYRVEVTASTLSELAGKLMALGSQLSAPMPAPTFSTAEAASFTAQANSGAVLGLGTVANADYQVYVADAPAKQELKAEDAPESVVEQTYDYNTQVAPRVLQMVSKRGRDAVKTLLASFAVSKASDLAAEKYPALMAAIDEAMGDK